MKNTWVTNLCIYELKLEKSMRALFAEIQISQCLVNFVVDLVSSSINNASKFIPLLF